MAKSDERPMETKPWALREIRPPVTIPRKSYFLIHCQCTLLIACSFAARLRRNCDDRFDYPAIYVLFAQLKLSAVDERDDANPCIR